ncbi:hypothetical protein HK099_005691 [Clydaea vesicula]|uniref:Fatty acid hydroxylase domain-containing protein n=1 Tax=Clydaea vesicula TaxID=447962 RepID=A0AAD5XXF2_9FUNG|nr:hypothetical protein HK099_005691 [Clydaea vesicula]
MHVAPIAISAQFAHPLAGPTICGSHILTMWAWMCIALLSTVNSHSDFDFPFLHRGSTRFHDFHHEKFNYCYGTLGFLDWLHGTDTAFVERYGASCLTIGLKSDQEKPKGGLVKKKKLRDSSVDLSYDSKEKSVKLE